MAHPVLTVPSPVRLFRPDAFLLSLTATVIASTLFPCQGNAARLLATCATVAISALFFLQGARLSRDAILNGLIHWRLHGLTAATTFLVIPAVGLTVSIVFWPLLPPQIWVGVLFLSALPSTVQSSIALTSIAKGNVSAAICSATISNLVGIILTPVLFAMLSRVHGGETDPAAIWKIVSGLLLPFVLGHMLRPWIGPWVGRHRAVLSLTDRSSVLLVVYTAFSAAAVSGLWRQTSPASLVILGIVSVSLFASAYVVTMLGGRILGLCAPDQAAALFCGSQKSLITGVPIANALFGGGAIGPVLLPIMLYHPMQMICCSLLARHYAMAIREPNSAEAPARKAEIEQPVANSVVA